MRFAIDVAFVRTLNLPESSGEALAEVVAVAPETRPGRFAWAAGADTAIELPSGKLAATATSVGHRLTWSG